MPRRSSPSGSKCCRPQPPRTPTQNFFPNLTVTPKSGDEKVFWPGRASCSQPLLRNPQWSRNWQLTTMILPLKHLLTHSSPMFFTTYMLVAAVSLAQFGSRWASEAKSSWTLRTTTFLWGLEQALVFLLAGPTFLGYELRHPWIRLAHIQWQWEFVFRLIPKE